MALLGPSDAVPDALLAPATANPNMMAQAASAREAQFRAAIMAHPWFQEFVKQHGEPPNLNDPDYDYRKAWAAGLRPQRYEHDGGRYHWPSALPNGEMLKGANHPTVWMEHFMRATGVDPNALGIKTPEEAQRYLEERNGR